MVRKAAPKTAVTKPISSPASARKEKKLAVPAALGKKVVFGNDDSEDEPDLPAMTMTTDDDDAPEAVSIMDLKKTAIEKLKTAQAESKSKKLAEKAAQAERQSKGRKVNLEKQEKLVAAKSANQAIDFSIFEEAERIEKIKKAESTKELSKKRNHMVLESSEFDHEPVKKKTSVKTRRISGFTVVPLDSTIIKQKPVSQTVVDFRREQIFGDRIKRRPASVTMTQTKDGAPPRFAKFTVKK
ncbi:hypothetical protein BDR26DRAFT_871916 [Obelidium mucronatum]|nr:hypothetical protein BDR26DRAFT_871916 [Obelidium mucronatum]